MRRALQAGVVFLLLTTLALPVRADPLLMFLLGVARDMVASSIKRDAAARPPAPEPAPEVYAGTSIQPAHVRQLIDENFSYLSTDQRDEVFQSLHAELVKPKNAAVRVPLIEYFAERAYQVRAARARLAQLSRAEMQGMAAEFSRQVRGITDEDREQLREVLRRGLLPVPDALGEMMLTALGPAPEPSEPVKPVSAAPGAAQTASLQREAAQSISVQ